MKEILLGENLRGAEAKLDLQELITGRTLLCSISRWGKTWTARRVVEQVFGRTGIIIVDVEGEYATLRDKFPLLIIGKDVPLVPESAEFLADQILEHDLSAIIDGSDPQLDIAAFQEFLARFIDRFIAMETKMRKPYLWILEEADELAPETGIARSICLNQIRKLVKKGGKRGLGTIVLTQRPAFVSKFVISQCPNKLIGRTEWPDDLAVLRKFGRIPKRIADPESKDSHAIKNLEKGQFYVSGDFIGRDELVKVGPVVTKHLGSTPELVPPAPKELKDILTQLSEKLPAIIQEKLAPVVPKVAEIEGRIKEKFEAQWQARLARKNKELSSIKNRLEAKYEIEIADLKRKLDEAVRHAALRGGVSDLLSHPLVQKNLEKLNAKQRGFVELLETKGPQDPERCSLFLEISPKSVPPFVYAVNRKIPRLIESVQGRYVSRLVKLFPVTEEAKVEAKEIEQLQTQIATLQRRLNEEIKDKNRLSAEASELRDKLKSKELEKPEITPKVKTPPTPLAEEPVIPVDVTLRRKLADFKVEVDHEVLTADESSWEGKILTRGLDGFFDEPQGIGKIMGELVRRYGVGDSITGDAKLYWMENDNLRLDTMEALHHSWESGNVINTLGLKARNTHGMHGERWPSVNNAILGWSRVVASVDHGIKDVYEVELHDGKRIKITLGHSLFTGNHVRRCLKPEKLDKLQGVASVHSIPLVGCSSGYSPSFMVLLGLWIGDGSWCRITTENRLTGIAIATGDDPSIVAFLKIFCQEHNFNLRPKSRGDYRIYSKKLVDWMLKSGLSPNCVAETKRVPDWIFTLSADDIAAFLKGYFSADGSLYRRRDYREDYPRHAVVDCSSVNRSLLDDVQILLSRLGICSVIDTGYVPKSGFATGGDTRVWKLRIEQTSHVLDFIRRIGRIQNVREQYVKELEHPKRSVARGQLRSIMLRRIRNVSYAGKQRVYDLKVNPTESFVANGIVCHNSGGNRTTVGNRLVMLVSKGILDRKQEKGQWTYSATPEFRDRVKGARGAE